MSMNALIAGVGMVKFAKPGKSEPYDRMAADAALLALKDSGLEYRAVQQAYVGFVTGDTTSGQQALYQIGLTGIPIINVNNACSSGSTALFLARQAVESGVVDVALAVGFEQMTPGAQGSSLSDRPPVNSILDSVVERAIGWDAAIPQAVHYFGGAAREYQAKYGIRNETLASIAVKARRHAAMNPMALFQAPLTVDEVLASPTLMAPLTRFQCCPPTCGAAATVVVSQRYAKQHGLSACVEILGQALTTDPESSFKDASMIKAIGYDMAKNAAAQVYERAGIGPEAVDVVELHDCFTINEIATYESLGLCAEGEAEKFVVDGDNGFGGKVVTNPSGGLLSKGHPMGATGLAQIAELVWQVRGDAGARQVANAKIALQHNLGLGGACVVTMLRAA